jgi:hypothetical protein
MAIVFSSPEAKVGPTSGASQVTWCRCRSVTLGVVSEPSERTSTMLGLKRVM